MGLLLFYTQARFLLRTDRGLEHGKKYGAAQKVWSRAFWMGLEEDGNMDLVDCYLTGDDYKQE